MILIFILLCRVIYDILCASKLKVYRVPFGDFFIVFPLVKGGIFLGEP